MLQRPASRYVKNGRYARAANLKGSEGLLADPCSYCAGPGQHFDHIEPVARGGRNHLSNLTRACAKCNKEKGLQPALLFLARRALRSI